VRNCDVFDSDLESTHAAAVEEHETSPIQNALLRQGITTVSAFLNLTVRQIDDLLNDAATQGNLVRLTAGDKHLLKQARGFCHVILREFRENHTSMEIETTPFEEFDFYRRSRFDATAAL